MSTRPVGRADHEIVARSSTRSPAAANPDPQSANQIEDVILAIGPAERRDPARNRARQTTAPRPSSTASPLPMAERRTAPLKRCWSATTTPPRVS